MPFDIIHIYPKSGENGKTNFRVTVLYRVNNSIMRDLINYKNDLLALEDILKELDTGAPNHYFRKNICSEDDLRSRIFRTFVVKFLACLPLLGFSDI